MPGWLGPLAHLGLGRLYWVTAIGPFTAVRRAVFEKVGGYPRSLFEDAEFSRRVRGLGHQAARAPFRVHVHRPFAEGLAPGTKPYFDLYRERLRRAWDVPFTQDGPAIVVTPRTGAAAPYARRFVLERAQGPPG
jgi:GT2 family glycosyltransferase